MLSPAQLSSACPVLATWVDLPVLTGNIQMGQRTYIVCLKPRSRKGQQENIEFRSLACAPTFFLR